MIVPVYCHDVKGRPSPPKTRFIVPGSGFRWRVSHDSSGSARLTLAHLSFSPDPGKGGPAGPPFGFRDRGTGEGQAFIFFAASVRAGTTWNRSPQIPYVATLKIGASGSLLIATITFDEPIPARCWMAPEMPQAT